MTQDAVPSTRIDSSPTSSKELERLHKGFLALTETTHKILATPEWGATIRLYGEALQNLIPAGDTAVFSIHENGSAATLEFYSAETPPEPPEPAMVEWITAQAKSVTLPTAGDGHLTVIPLKSPAAVLGFATIDTSLFGDAGPPALLIDLIDVVSGYAATALQNVRLVETIRERLDDLAETRNYLNNILDSISNGLLTLNLDHHVQQMNRNFSAMLEIDTAESEGRHYRDVLPSTLADSIDHQIAQIQESGFCMEEEYSYRLSGGQEVKYALGISPLRNEHLQVIGTIILIRDMTASIELERLRRLDTLKSQFVANVSHELKTPLTSIKAYTEALIDMATEEMQQNFLGVIDEESDRLLYLIEDLLNLARIESGKLTLKKKPHDPRAMIEEILNISKVQSNTHNVLVQYADNIPDTMLYDKAKMKEVMINLVGNAIKYSPKGGKVTVISDVLESNLRIRIIDEGLGISEQNIKKIFDQFFRVDSSLTTAIGGTGLGLAITKNIVEAHDGRITVQSTVGVGTTFTVLLPIQTT